MQGVRLAGVRVAMMNRQRSIIGVESTRGRSSGGRDVAVGMSLQKCIFRGLEVVWMSTRIAGQTDNDMQVEKHRWTVPVIPISVYVATSGYAESRIVQRSGTQGGTVLWLSKLGYVDGESHQERNGMGVGHGGHHASNGLLGLIGIEDPYA